MLTAKIPLQKTEQVKKHIIKENLLDRAHKIEKGRQFIYFPIKSKFNNFSFVKFINKNLPKKQSTDLREILKDKLSKKEYSLLKTAYDVVGDIAILEIDKEILPKAKIIADTLLKTQKQIKVVLRKTGSHKGKFRTQDMQVVSGEKRKETIHKENGITLKLNVEKVYFSARLSTERKRIYQLIKPGEDILVMFSGCGPYPLVLAKNPNTKSVFAIEINPSGHKYALDNIKLNKKIIGKTEITAINGDVNKELPKIKKKFDRVLMPLPKTAEDFLDLALKSSKKGTIVHFYDFLDEKDIPDKAIGKIDKACKKQNTKYKILHHVKCGQHSPRTFRLCVDFQIL